MKEKYRLPENRQPAPFLTKNIHQTETTTQIIKTRIIEDIDKNNSDVVPHIMYAAKKTKTLMVIQTNGPIKYISSKELMYSSQTRRIKNCLSLVGPTAEVGMSTEHQVSSKYRVMGFLWVIMSKYWTALSNTLVLHCPAAAQLAVLLHFLVSLILFSFVDRGGGGRDKWKQISVYMGYLPHVAFADPLALWAFCIVLSFQIGHL